MSRRKPRRKGLRKYWPHLTLKECEVERQKLSDAQAAKCFICQRPESGFKVRLSVDHNHRSLRVRGLLCAYCNRFLVARHTIATARAVLNYLLKFDLEET